MRILIVDDDKDILSSFRIGLEDYDFQLTLLTSPIKALKEYKRKRFDLVISDINMPEMNGIELLKKLKETNPDAKVILITAFHDFVNTITAIKSDVYSFFLKPIDIKEVITEIEFLRSLSNEKSR